ncbi:uncharacterized protein TNCV_5128431 [Trichonephila clavipes]|nr:uncharacterized protein TNCV_5128431 [Trichonephila clavipes]
MATGSYLNPIYSRSQRSREVSKDLVQKNRTSVTYVNGLKLTMYSISTKIVASSSNWYWARTCDKASHSPIPIPLGYRGRKKSRREETVAPTTSDYNLRPRIRKREESRPTIERKTQQGRPVRSRKGRERNHSPYIEEQTRSSNKNARRGGDQQRQDQERRGTCTKKSLSLEILVGNANYKS